MENNKVRVEVGGMFPSYDEAIQGAMDELSQLARDHKAELARLQDEVDELEHRALHRMIMMETSFSGSEESRNLVAVIGQRSRECCCRRQASPNLTIVRTSLVSSPQMRNIRVLWIFPVRCAHTSCTRTSSWRVVTKLS